MWFSVTLVKFHWFGINWHDFNQSECRNCCLYIIIEKIAPQAKSGKYFQIWFFPRFGGKKWRRSEHAHASFPGLFFRPRGFSPSMGREERRVQGLDNLLSERKLLLILENELNPAPAEIPILPTHGCRFMCSSSTYFYFCQTRNHFTINSWQLGKDMICARVACIYWRWPQYFLRSCGAFSIPSCI